MNLQLPSVKRYINGVVFSLVALGVLYVIFGVIQIVELNLVVSLLVGLLAGHFIGAVVAEPQGKTKNKKITPSEGIQTLYIGNLAFKTSRHELNTLFEPYGTVHSTRIMVDKATRKPRGYAFVEMDSNDAIKAISELNGSLFAGRNIKVSAANERSAR
ncbi:MAG: hypothetical protein GXP08_02260 [Gammaproteobacteria bacterium]|nr:hypothetical protein [Gammaproteobacteria bacterium]